MGCAVQPEVHFRNGLGTMIGFRSRLLSAEIQHRLAREPRALAAAHYARENVAQPVRLEVVSQRAGMTPSAFSRYFAEKVGITFSGLVKLLRIESALEALEYRDGAISSVALRSGYQSCATFSRAFKDVMGETPSEYRRRMLFMPAQERAS